MFSFKRAVGQGILSFVVFSLCCLAVIGFIRWYELSNHA